MDGRRPGSATPPTLTCVQTVVEVTDHSIGVVSPASPPELPRALVDAALDWIDDPVGLLAEQPVDVADLWRTVMATLVGQACDSVVLIHPPEWPRHRIDRMVAAANAVTDRVDAVGRGQWRGEASGPGDADDENRGSGDDPPHMSRHPRTALLGAMAVLALSGMALAIRSGVLPQPPSERTVVEGRMAVRIPEHWTVERVTGGPGSRRLRVSAPGDRGIAMHLTWAYAPETTLAQAADVLSAAMAAEPPGVFVDLRPGGEAAGRPAVTYRELRTGSVIAWSVVLDGSTRISVGCQSPPGREAEVRAACDEAVHSARET